VTLFELLTTIRNSAPNTIEYRHPLSRYSFCTIYADVGNRGQFAQRTSVPCTCGTPGATLAPSSGYSIMTVEYRTTPTGRKMCARSMSCVVPGDYLCVAGLGGSAPGVGRGGGHWRGGSDAPPQPARSHGERGGDSGAGRDDCDRERKRDGGWFRDERDRRPIVTNFCLSQYYYF
jgi:histone deacetylase complex subunit SAP18